MSCGLRHGKDKRLCSREPDRAFPVSEGRDLSGVGQGESGGEGYEDGAWSPGCRIPAGSSNRSDLVPAAGTQTHARRGSITCLDDYALDTEKSKAVKQGPGQERNKRRVRAPTKKSGPSEASRSTFVHPRNAARRVARSDHFQPA